MVRGVAERSGNLRIRTARRLAITLLVLVIAGAIQALSFYQLFAPRVASASAATYALMLENSQRALYRQLAVDIEPWFDSTSGNEAEERTLAKAWSDFDGHFAAAPFEAIVALGEELPALLASAGADVARSDQIITQLERLQIIYTDTNKALLAELKRPPLYLWPIAPLAAERSGYRQAVTYNRALYLAQTGDIGTSRVMLAGLNASAEDPEVLDRLQATHQQRKQSQCGSGRGQSTRSPAVLDGPHHGAFHSAFAQSVSVIVHQMDGR